MPTESIYLPESDRAYVKQVESDRGLDNESQAVQAIIDDHREGDDE
jgi:hypothetical protein